jgi:hypothetical protein
VSLHAATGTRYLGLCLLAATVAACGIPPLSVSTPAATPAAVVSPKPTLRPGPTAVPGAEPPQAVMIDLEEEPVAGDLGTFAWDGFASDSPWILGPAAGSAVAGADLAVELRPGGNPSAWQASWARVADGQAAGPSDVSALRGGPIELVAPKDAGAWSLQLFARFGTGREAAWYWQVEVQP